MAVKNFIEFAVFGAFILFVYSEKIDLEGFKQISGLRLDKSVEGRNYLTLNLYNVSLHIDSFNGNTITITQGSSSNSIFRGSGSSGGFSVSGRAFHKKGECRTAGVYWRPWNGTIPKDAILGGMRYDKSNIPIYMGQMVIMYHRGNSVGGIQPVRIYKDSVNVTSSFWIMHTSSRHVNILCAVDPKLVIWTPVEKVRLFKNDKDLVVAGVENIKENLFFGRTVYRNELIIGKAGIDMGMIFPYDDQEVSVTSNYEILTYNKYRGAFQKRE